MMMNACWGGAIGTSITGGRRHAHKSTNIAYIKKHKRNGTTKQTNTCY